METSVHEFVRCLSLRGKLQSQAIMKEDVKELVETIISDSWSFPALRP